MLLLASSAALAEELQISLKPPSLVLGSGETVSVLVRLPRTDVALKSATSAGTLVPTAELGSTERHFTWTPPHTRFPMTALLVFWTEEHGAPPMVAQARVALSGRTSLEVQTEPSALVRVQVAGSTYGPQRADKHGKVDVPIEVPPGVETAQVLAEAQGRTTTRAAALSVPVSSALLAAISPNPPVQGEPCWLIVAHPDTFQVSQLRLELSGARFELENSAPTRVLYRLDMDDGAREITAAVSFGDEQAQVAARVLSADDPFPGSAPFAARRFSASASAGGFYAGGANSGAALAIVGSYALPAAAGRFTLDLELGYRSSSLSAPAPGLGSVHSSLSAVPVELALRALVFQRGAWSIYGRVGGGILPFNVSAHSDFQPSFAQSGVAVEGFASAQVGYRMRPVELFGELRGGIAPVHTSALDARLGGLLLALGARYPIQ